MSTQQSGAIELIDKLGLTPFQEQLAVMVAEGTRTNNEIVRKMKIHLWTLQGLKAHPKFQDRVRELREAVAPISEKFWISKKERRLKELEKTYRRQEQRWQRLLRIVEERAERHGNDPDFQPIPGIETGFVLRRERAVGTSGRIVVEYAVDGALLKEFRELETAMGETLKHGAIEVGQWKEDGKSNDAVGQHETPTYIVVVKNANSEPKPIEQIRDSSNDGVGETRGEEIPGIPLP